MRQKDIKIGDDLYWDPSADYAGAYGRGRRVTVLDTGYRRAGSNWRPTYTKVAGGRLVKVEIVDNETGAKISDDSSRYVTANSLRGPWAEVLARVEFNRQVMRDEAARERAERAARLAHAQAVMDSLGRHIGAELLGGPSGWRPSEAGTVEIPVRALDRILELLGEGSA